MFASNNKPTKRSARTRGGAERPHADRRATRSDAQMSRNQSVHSFDRSVYGNSSAHNSRRKSAGAEAYSASNYGSSTHRANNRSSNYIPATPAGANRRYAQNAKSREFVRQQHERKKKVSASAYCLCLLR